MSPRRSDHAEIINVSTSTGFTVEVMRTWYRAQEFARHSHPYFTIGVMQQGIGTLWASGVAHTMRPGDVVMIPPGEVHTGGLDDRGGLLSYVALHVPAGIVAQAAESQSLGTAAACSFATSVIRDDLLAAEIAGVHSAVALEKDPVAAEAGIVAAIERMVRRGAESSESRHPRAEPPHVRIARTVIEDCYADSARTTLSSLALAADVSPFHLVREFKRAIGLSPHQYIVQTRVRRAADLIERGSAISDAALTVGFTDQSHLTTHFRRHLGATPASWQRAHRLAG